MSKFQGEVAKVYEKTIKTRRGPSSVYSVKLDTEEDVWFAAGFNKPDCEEGDYVQFEAEKNERGYWHIPGSIMTIERPKSDVAKAGGGSGGSGFAAEKELRYNYRFSVASAQDFALAALQAGLLPKSGGKTAKAKEATLDDLQQFIDERTAMIFARCMDTAGLQAILDSQEVVAVEEVTPGPGPDEDDD